MQGKIEYIKMRGITSAVPENIVDNWARIANTENKRLRKQLELTGIHYRRVTTGGQKASDLAALSAESLLRDLGWDRASLDVLIFVTQSSDLQRPGTAFLIQDWLGLGDNCLVYDINMGCAGYIGGLITICSILNMVKGRGLLLTGESNAIDGKEIHRNAFLEGDAASATALEYDEGIHSDICFSHHSDGKRADLLYMRYDGVGTMDGNAILLFGLSEAADLIRNFMKENKISCEDIDYFVFHQAQKMIVDGIADVVGIPKDKVLVSYETFGNTSSASIPLTLCHTLGSKETGRKRVLLCGYGIGLAWGCVLMDLDTDVVHSIIESDYCYDKSKFGL